MENCYKVKKNKAYKWTSGLEYLVEHPDERRQIAKNAYEYVRKNHNAPDHIHKWIEMYKELLEK
jgi:spore maturation protein CgeB